MTDVSKYNAYYAQRSYKDVRKAVDTVANSSLASQTMTATSVGYPVIWKSTGWQVAAADEKFMGVLDSVQADGSIGVQTKGIVLMEKGSGVTINPGDWVEGAGSHLIQADNTNAKGGARCFAAYDSTHVWVDLG